MKKGQGKRLLIGLIAVFILFQIIAGALGSDRGQAGVIVGGVAAAAMVIAERLLFGGSYADAFKAVGLGRPSARGILVAIAVCIPLLAAIPFFAVTMNTAFDFYPGWAGLAVGLFFQAGIGEETMFRGYLFGHMRQRHTFWKAAAFAAVPFVVVHLILFYSLTWTIGTASILLAVAMSFPLSRLFEMGRDTIWGPAIVHFVTQAGVKLLVPSGEYAWVYPFYWITVCAIVPLGVYAIPLVARLSKKLITAPAAGLLIAACCFSASGQTPEPSLGSEFFSREELTGDWDGARTRLREKGVDLRFRLTQYYQGTKGDGAYSDKLDTNFRFDMEKMFGWKRLSVQLKTETRFGRSPRTGASLPLNAGVVSPKGGEDAAFSITALNFTQLIPVREEKGDFIAVGAGKYYSLDSSREPFTGGAGVTRFIGIAANGNPAVGLMVSNGATFAWVRKGSPFVTFAVFDPVGSPTKAGLKRLFARGVTFVPGISVPTNFAKRSGRHSLSASVTTRKFTPFDHLAQFVQPGQPRVPVVPKSGSWSLTYTFNQYIRESGAGAEKNRLGRLRRVYGGARGHQPCGEGYDFRGRRKRFVQEPEKGPVRCCVRPDRCQQKAENRGRPAAENRRRADVRDLL